MIRRIDAFLRSIAVPFRKAVHSLRRKALKAKRLAGELSIAHDIQMEMLPKTFSPFPGHPALELYARQRPAREVGGDFYDFFICGDRLVFAVGDVSGKGIPAAIVMAITKSLFRAFASACQEPSEIAGRLNSSLSDNNEANMFVTMFIGTLDLNDRTLSWCNAGHNPPVLTGSAGAGYMHPKVSLPIGVMPGTVYKTESIALLPDDCLLVYTDGLTEAENSSRELFGEERLLNLCSSLGSLAPEVLLGRIDGALASFVGPARQSDDLTMFALRYGGWFLEISNDLKETSRISGFMERIGKDAGIEAPVMNRLNLAVEELMVNAVEYAYQEGTEGKICLNVVREDSGALVFVLSDSGRPFDPTMAPDPDLSLDADSRPVGGLGIFLARKIMDGISYRREGRRNVLTMRKTV